MENEMKEPEFNGAQMALEIHKILSSVSVSGPNNIHNMDVAMQGLIIMSNKLKEEKEKSKAEEI